MSLSFWLLSAITFLSAFLLFQIELIIAKLFLPVYGGSYLVWGACVVFFQFVLLAGYVFAHYGIERFGIHTYLKIHTALLVLPFLVFPGRALDVHGASSQLLVVLDVFVRLLTTIGPVFFVLSTASLVTQSWLSASKMEQRRHPYVLYAISNIGSFLALWTYPFVFEYFLTNTDQLNIWRMLYVFVVGLNLFALKTVDVRSVHKAADPDPLPKKHTVVTRGVVIRWLLLSAASVVLFLSVTNLITYEVAPVPLLWIIPLSVYLLSFVLNFKERPWCPSWIKFSLPIVLVAAVLLYFKARTFLPVAWAIILFNFILFIGCMYAQNELIKSKPAAKQLTLFYVMISLGGFAGGFFTSWIVPLISHTPVEFLLGLLLIAATYPSKVWRLVLIFAMAAAILYDYTIKPHHSVVTKRNYYGIYDVFDKGGVRSFVHGTTLHGLEWIDLDRRIVPLGYYSPFSPLGQVFIKDIFSAKSVGAVGLGVGTMAMFSRKDMSMDFYELDPDVLAIAKSHFWYLESAPGPIRVATGDARIALAQNTGAVYDLLVIDAFGGDSVPSHLINRDVLGLYRQHLSPRGGILFHIPNRYFDLQPVLARIAADTGAFAVVKEATQDGITMHTFWAVLTWDAERFERLIAEGWKMLTPDRFPPQRTWTDDFSTTLPILKLDELWGSLTHYKFF